MNCSQVYPDINRVIFAEVGSLDLVLFWKLTRLKKRYHNQKKHAKFLAKFERKRLET